MISSKALSIPPSQKENKMRRVLGHQGQGVVESLLALPLILLALVALGALLYRGVLYYATDYHLHEALICLDSASISECESQVQNRLKFLLLNEEPVQISLKKNSLEYRGQVKISLTPPLSFEQRRPRSL